MSTNKFHMTKTNWGNSVWFLFHTLAEKIIEKKFIEQKNNLLELITIICGNLPCPDCSSHAIIEINQINVNNIKSKEDFKLLLFEFHNRVNKKLNKPPFTMDELNKKYSTANLVAIINNFNIVYNQNTYNEKLLINTFHKNLQNKRLYILLNTILQNCS